VIYKYFTIIVLVHSLLIPNKSGINYFSVDPLKKGNINLIVEKSSISFNNDADIVIIIILVIKLFLHDNTVIQYSDPLSGKLI